MKDIKKWYLIALLMMAYDFGAIWLAQFGALWLRFDLRYSMIPKVYLNNMFHMAPYMAVVVVVVLWRFRLYQSIWRYASFMELVRIIGAVSAITLVRITLILCGVFGRMPVSYYIVGWGLSICFLALVRFGYRAVLLLRSNAKKGGRVNVMIVGAGQAGQLLVHDSRHSRWQSVRIRCLIDDDKNKQGRFIDNILIVGGRDSILKAAAQYEIDEIYIALPTATAAEKRDILSICQNTGCALRPDTPQSSPLAPHKFLRNLWPSVLATFWGPTVPWCPSLRNKLLPVVRLPLPIRTSCVTL